MRRNQMETHNPPLDARHGRQWHSAQLVGKSDALMETVIAPQLHAPLTKSLAAAMMFNDRDSMTEFLLNFY